MTLDNRNFSAAPTMENVTVPVVIHATDFENPVISGSGTTLKIDGWERNNTATIAYVTSGSKQMRINSTLSAQGAQQYFQVTAGASYTISVDLTLPSGTLAQVTAYQASGIGGTLGSGSTIISTTTAGTNTYTGTIVGSFTSTGYIMIKISYGSTYMLVDNFKLTNGTSIVSVTGEYNDYAYGFQGQEEEDDIKGEGNSYDFGSRMYDPRVGRWLTLDPQSGKQPSQSPYKAFFNNPLYWADPNGETEYETIIITDEKTGTTTKVSIVRSSKVMTTGKVNYSKKLGIPYQNYFDYSKVTRQVVHEDGTVTEKTTTEILKKNGVKYCDHIPLDLPLDNAAKYGDIYDPEWDFEVSGGFYMTGEGGQGTNYWSKDPDYVGDIDLLLSTMKAWQKGGSATPIPTNGTMTTILKGVGKHQMDIIKKTLETIKTAKSDSPESTTGTPRDLEQKTYSNKVIWKKAKGEKDNEGYHKEATDEEIENGDTLGGNPPVNVYPKK